MTVPLPPEPLTTIPGELPPERVDEFVRLLGQNQRRIFLYIMGLAPNWSDAEEIVQNTNLVLWREFAQFQPGTNFTAWACKVAFHQVLAWRKRKQRDRLQFSDVFLEAVAEDSAAAADLLEERSAVLAGCIDKLPDNQRALIRQRYAEGLSVEAIAQQCDRTVEAVYRALSRIRQTLHECVSKQLPLGSQS
ncbi:MAG: sigma-70 family RNA polymerase sigma factor [Planctomycetia bacterium]|nr:sigma-70 family RNA polymerase sigma factor [Planctomycetia bacterium]